MRLRLQCHHVLLLFLVTVFFLVSVAVAEKESTAADTAEVPAIVAY
jgi:hypothetical protein